MLFLFLLFCLDCRIWNRARINYPFIFEFDARHFLNWQQLSEVSALSGLRIFADEMLDTMLLPLPVGTVHVAQLSTKWNKLHVPVLARHSDRAVSHCPFLARTHVVPPKSKLVCVFQRL